MARSRNGFCLLAGGLTVIVMAGEPKPTLGASPNGVQCDMTGREDAPRFTATPATLKSVLERAVDGGVVSLTAGDYGAVMLATRNRRFVTLTASAGQTARLSSLGISGGHWLVRGLTITGVAPRHMWGRYQAHDYLVNIRNAENVVLDGDTIASTLEDFPWRQEIAGVLDEPGLSSGISSVGSSCVTISNNRITNVFNGIAVYKTNTSNNFGAQVITNNTIDNFAGDGIDIDIGNMTISKNLISNNHDICLSLCVHEDAIQGLANNGKMTTVNENITIVGNRIINFLSPRSSLDTGGLQGISFFDNAWRNMLVADNLVITNTWNGISIMGADGAFIVNNTVLASTFRKTWITAGWTSHQGAVSHHVVVKNNLVSALNMPQGPGMATDTIVDHNLIVKDARQMVRRFDPNLGLYDARLRTDAPAIGRGDSDAAPPRDIEGRRRVGRVDLGAYQHPVAP